VRNVFPLASPKSALTVVVPTARPDANPSALIVATSENPEVQTTEDVRSRLLPSANLPCGRKLSCDAHVDGRIGGQDFDTRRRAPHQSISLRQTSRSSSAPRNQPAAAWSLLPGYSCARSRSPQARRCQHPRRSRLKISWRNLFVMVFYSSVITLALIWIVSPFGEPDDRDGI
jgi:hypothetical protein